MSTLRIDCAPELSVALDRIGQIGILPKLFGDVIRPQSVQAELQAGKQP